MDCPRKIKLPNELLSEFILCLPFNFGYPTIRVSAVFDFFLAKKQQNFRKRNEEAIIRQQEIVAQLGCVFRNAVKQLIELCQFENVQAIEHQQKIAIDAAHSFSEAAKHRIQLVKLMSTAKTETEPLEN